MGALTAFFSLNDLFMKNWQEDGDYKQIYKDRMRMLQQKKD